MILTGDDKIRSPLSVGLPEAGTAMRWAALWRARRRMRFWTPAAQ